MSPNVVRPKHRSIRAASLAATLSAASLACLLTGCGEEKRPETLKQIRDQRVGIPALYLTKNGKEVIAPEDEGQAVLESESGEIAFRAMECKNPSCPGTGSGDRPYLFIWEDPLYYVDDEGNLAFDWNQDREQETLAKGGTIEPRCPACLNTRNRKTETPAQRDQYASWSQSYVLPEAKERLKELEEERQRRLKHIEERRARKVE